MARTHSFVLMFFATLAVARNQSLTTEVQPPRKFVFSGPVAEAGCPRSPQSIF